jgi:hypothetical protein
MKGKTPCLEIQGSLIEKGVVDTACYSVMYATLLHSDDGRD